MAVLLRGEKTEHLKNDKNRYSVGLAETLFNIAIFAVLNILPIIHNTLLAYMVLLYAVIMFLFVTTTTQHKRSNKHFVILGGGCFVGLVAFYVHCLIPRRNVISLGTVTLPEPVISKVMFIIGGIFALLSIWKRIRRMYYNLKI